MAATPYSAHDEYSACWLNLKPGQVYRLKIRAWERKGGSAAVCQGTMVFTLGAYQSQFDSAGGVPAALNHVFLDIDAANSCDVHLAPTTQRDMCVELVLQARNGKAVGDAYTLTVNKTANATFLLLLSYYYGG